MENRESKYLYLYLSLFTILFSGSFFTKCSTFETEQNDIIEVIGKVSDSLNQMPLNANVRLLQLGWSSNTLLNEVYTDENGNYKLTYDYGKECSRNYSLFILSVYADGYTPKSCNTYFPCENDPPIVACTSETQTFNFQLVKF